MVHTNGMNTTKINRLTPISFHHRNKNFVQYWLFKCDCGNMRIVAMPAVKHGDIKSCGCLAHEERIGRIGEKNPAWKGDKVGYGGVHGYVRKRKFKPEFCERCGIRPPLDLANKTGKYLRDLNDWEYLCRKCHMDGDGRAKKASEFQKSRKLPQKFCKECGKPYYRTSGQRTSKYCSWPCTIIGRGKTRKGMKYVST